MRRYAFVGLAVVAGVLAVVACGSDDDVTSTPGVDAGAKVDAKSSSSSSSSSGNAADSGPGVFTEKDQVACEGRTANDAFAVFVTPAGNDVANCGNREAPCKTVQNAIKVAYAVQKPKVLVGAGTYGEAIELPGGLVLEGGWDVNGTTWTANCSANHSSIATIESTTNIGVKATMGASVLRFVTVKSKATAAAGESLYGVIAQGPDVRVALDDANLVVAAGGAGATGAAGDGADPFACDAGAPDDGGVGDSGTAGGDASTPSLNGGAFTPGNGADGTNGVPGKSGAAAPAPPGVLTAKCEAAGPVCVPAPYTVTPKTGAPGCGGGGGKAGKAGSGGGASIGIIAIDAKVVTYGGTITTGAGGAGGSGGAGAEGAVGVPGVGGPSSDYAKTPTTGCTAAMPCANDTASLDGGAGGGAGGKGGTGGNGSGGSGGWSIGFVKVGNSALLTTATTFQNGGGGKGGTPNGPDGLGQQQYP